MTMIAVDADTRASCAEARAAARYGTPLFYYSLSALRQQIATLRRAMRGYPAHLLFATMANDRAAILRAIADDGVGACVNSIPHLERAVANGFATSLMQFTSCGLPVADMAYLQSLGVAANLDSPGQVRAWCSLGPGAVVGARINAAALNGAAGGDRIGMDLDDFARARAIARDLGGRVNGVHVYAGTNFQTAADILPTLRAILTLAGNCADIDYVNIGGGIGVDYSHTADPFDYDGFGTAVAAIAWQASRGRATPITLFFEPGRSLVASSAQFITRVTDIKTLGGTRFVVVDASVSVFPRPYHHPGNWHRARVLDAGSSGELAPSTVVGRTTFSRDILGNYALPDDLRVGSLIAFDDAGAYCESMMSRFLGQRDPACYLSEE